MKHRSYGRKKRRLLKRLRWLWAWSVVISACLLLGMLSLAAVRGIRDFCDEHIKGNSNQNSHQEEFEPAKSGDSPDLLLADAGGEPDSLQQAAWSEDLKELSQEASSLLVNKSEYLPTDYDMPMTALKNGQQVAAVCYNDLRSMLFDGEEEQSGLSFLVASGYRSSEEQQRLLDEEIKKNMAAGMDEKEARQDALLTVAPAHYSEHETGLAVDIVATGNQRMDETQEYTEENIWLRENCWRYGFILRYPKEKEEITGFSYEAWHFRYVGRDAAKQITEQGITLEEYLQGEQHPQGG